MDEWLAIDIYPEYRRKTFEMLEFIKITNLHGMFFFRRKIKAKKVK